MSPNFHQFLLVPLNKSEYCKSLERKRKKVKSLSHVQLFATPWTVACTKLLCPWDFLGKNTGVGFHFLLQGIFPTQGSNPGLLHCRQTLYCLSHQGSPGESLEQGLKKKKKWILVLLYHLLVTRATYFNVADRLHSVQFSSISQSIATLCDPMNRSMPGLPVHHQLPEFTQT